MSALMVVAIVVVLATLGGIVWLCRYFGNELRGIWVVLGAILFGLWQIWCWFYCIRWRLRHGLQNVFGQTAAGVLLMGSFYIFVETALALVRVVRDSVAPGGTGDERVGRMLALFPTFEAPPFIVEIVLIALAALVFLHHFQEWRLRRREAVVPEELTELIPVCRPFLVKGDKLEEPNRKLFFATAMEGIVKILMSERSKHVISASLITKGQDDTGLVVAYVYPHNAPGIVVGTVLKSGESAAGKVYEVKEPVYVPSTRHLVGINMKTYQTAGLVYEKLQLKNEEEQEKKKEKKKNVDPVTSLICVPVLKDSAVSAVINVSSNKRNAFGPLDVAIVRLAAALLADASWQAPGAGTPETLDRRREGV